MVVDRKKRQQNVDSNSAYLVNRRLMKSLRANGTFTLQRWTSRRRVKFK